MPRRIEIELTSARPDGTWTWRAAGAREPKGVLDGALLYGGAKAGDVLKAEADFELEGITIVSVIAPKEATRPGPERIEVLGPPRAEVPGVTTQLVGRSDRRPGDRVRDRDDGRPRRERNGGRPQTDRDGSRPKRDGETSRPRRDGEPARTERGRDERVPRPEGRQTSAKPADRPRPARPARPDGESKPDRPRRQDAGRPGTARAPSEPDRRRARRLNPSNTHRQAVMDSLPPEQQPIAEQVLRGGIPAVRTALHIEREKAEAEGRTAPNSDQLISMAEGLLPRLKAAEWRDRAEAAVTDTDTISLRDLRSVVSSADVARDDETRALAATLREALDRRVTALYGEWSAEISKHLDENRLVRAVRVSARPPDPAARLDGALGQRLADAAGAAMSPDTPAERWMALIEAVVASPIRRIVQPVGLPPDAPADLKRAAHQSSGSIPALGKLLGVAIPPPPSPTALRKRQESRPPKQRRTDPETRAAPPAPAAAEPEPDPEPPAAPAAAEPDPEPPGAPAAAEADPDVS